MHHPPQPEPQSPLADFKQGVDAMAGLCAVAAFPIVACTTRLGTWGTKYLGRTALLGLLWPLLFAALYGPHPRGVGLWLFWQALVVVLVAHRVAGRRRRRDGYRCHTKYWGRSWFEKDGDDIPAQRKARDRTNAFAVMAGILAIPACPPLAAMLLIGAVAKSVTESMTFRAVDARLEQMEDARIENEYLLDLYRRRTGAN